MKDLLKEIETKIDFAFLKQNSLRLLEDYFLEDSNEYLEEYEEELFNTEGLKLKDLEKEYIQTSIVFFEGRNEPYVITKINLNHPTTDLTCYCYSVEYDFDGNVLDDFWAKF